MLDYLVDDVDGDHHVALVLLVIADDGTELRVGLARIIRYADDPTAADLAVTVVDDWQGRGRRPQPYSKSSSDNDQRAWSGSSLPSMQPNVPLAMLRRLGEVEVSAPRSGAQQVVVELPDANHEPRPPD